METGYCRFVMLLNLRLAQNAGLEIRVLTYRQHSDVYNI